MSVLLFALASAAVVPATPIAANEWFTSKEHPKTAMQVAARGQVAYAIVVSPEGAALRCDTPEDGDLDRKVCELLMKSARFTPARNDQGQPTFGLHEATASFLMPGKNNRRPDRARLAVPVDSLPAGVTGPAYARVGFAVDTAGTISHCAALAGERRRFMQTVEALGPAACEAVMRDYRATVVRDAAGAPVPSVRSLTVRFELRPKP